MNRNTRPPVDWLADVTELIHQRPDLAGVGVSAAAVEVTA